MEVLHNRWGHLEVDWFAPANNAKLPIFYSRYWNEIVLVEMLVYLIEKIRKVCYAVGVIVVPLWKSASFWPLIWNGNSFIKNVIDWIDLPVAKEYYIPCKNNSGMFGKENLKFRMLALKVDFRGNV